MKRLGLTLVAALCLAATTFAAGKMCIRDRSGLYHRSASFYALTRYIAEYPHAGKHAVAGGSDRFR